MTNQEREKILSFHAVLLINNCSYICHCLLPLSLPEACKQGGSEQLNQYENGDKNSGLMHTLNAKPTIDCQTMIWAFMVCSPLSTPPTQILSSTMFCWLNTRHYINSSPLIRVWTHTTLWFSYKYLIIHMKRCIKIGCEAIIMWKHFKYIRLWHIPYPG